MIIMIKLTHLYTLSLRVVNIIIMLIVTTTSEVGQYQNYDFNDPPLKNLKSRWVNIIIMVGQYDNSGGSV
jgi:hypothetical protein